MEIDLPEVVAEVRAAFERYEKALVSTTTSTRSTRMFRDDPRTIRYGAAENLYGYAEIKAFRVRALAGRARPHPVEDRRSRPMAAISRWPRHCFDRPSAPARIGRQMQTWVRFADGWHVVAAHVSLIERLRRPDHEPSLHVIEIAAAARPRRAARRWRANCGCSSPTRSCAACSRRARRSTRWSLRRVSRCRARRCARRSASSPRAG